MSFKQTVERNLNNDMQCDGQPGAAPIEMEDVDMDVKKSAFPPHQEEFKDSKEQPPRFSTLYGLAPKISPPSLPTPPSPPPPPPPQAYDYHREYYGSAPRARKSGVTIPMPLFIVLTILFALMSIVLFAYTIIGLYNNAPSRVFPWAGPGTIEACSPGQQQPSINFAPNFVMPQAGKIDSEASIVTITIPSSPSTSIISATPSTTTVSASSDSTSSSTTSTKSTSSATDASAAASGILGALVSLGASESSTSASIALVTVGPTPSTVTSIQLVTKDPSGNIISNSMVTRTSTTVVGASSSSTGSITSRAEASTLATFTPGSSTGATTGWSAVSSALDSAESSTVVA